ncbi:MAG: CapA family protein [Ruminococcaceae bacterium]|nr:CapA family protein [Oscillospiraceae bacterium]
MNRNNNQNIRNSRSATRSNQMSHTGQHRSAGAGYSANAGSGYGSGQVRRSMVTSHNGYHRNTPSQKRKKRRDNNGLALFIIILSVIAAVSIACIFLLDPSSQKNPSGIGTTGTSENRESDVRTDTSSDSVTSDSVSSSPTEKPSPYNEMTLLCTGDVMYHSQQIESAFNSTTGTYDFNSTYAYIRDIVSDADYAVANFETTLAGESYPYQGFPRFNSPDTALTALESAGFDMMLFANNHCYDTEHHGLIRTQQLFDSIGIDYIGARTDLNDKTYKIIEVNGIKLGMLNSTDDLAYGNTANRTLNGIKLAQGDIPLIDIFNHSLLEEFYASVSTSISAMKENGADMIVFFIHWGNEYELKHNYMQETIAQKLCNLGVDVIIGGHPHVVQDADILTSESDPSHKTVCFYSLGNLVSNQNRLTMGDLYNKAYTENGLIVELTIRKYNDGRCIVSNVKTVPLWVHRYHTADYSLRYNIIPIEKALADPTGYGLYNSSFGFSHATEALKMTNATLAGFVNAFAEEITPFIPS